MKLVILFLSLLAVVSCGRKSGNTTRVGASGGGVYGSSNAIYGRVTVYFNQCGSNSARIQLGDSSGYQVQEQTVQNGGTYSFQVNPGVYYHLAATAGTCQVSTMNSQPLQASQQNICLGTSCMQSKMTFSKTGAGRLSQKSNTAIQSPFCSWQSWGCEPVLVGNGGSLFESSLSFQTKKPTALEFELSYAADNNWVFTTPAYNGKSWKFDVAADGKISVDDASYERLIVKSQIARSSLQLGSGFCGKTAELPGKIAEYAKLQGFSDDSQKGLASRVTSVLPEVSELCVYPQEEGQISKSLTLKSSKTVELRRLWFLMVPQLTTAQMKKAEKSSLPQKPKADALVAARKSTVNRSVANAADVNIEDVGLGFLIQSK